MQAPLCMNNVVGEEIQRQDRQDCQDDDKKKVMEILQSVSEGRNSEVSLFIWLFILEW